MGFFQANIWKHSFFKGVKSLFSTSKRIQKCVFISEAGVIKLESLKLATGYCRNDEEKLSWAVIQKAKEVMEGVEEMVLLISERTYLPLSPLNRIDKADKATIEPLDELAGSMYDEAFTRVTEENRKNGNAELLKTLAYIAVFGAMVVAAISLIKC